MDTKQSHCKKLTNYFKKTTKTYPNKFRCTLFRLQSQKKKIQINIETFTLPSTREKEKKIHTTWHNFITLSHVFFFLSFLFRLCGYIVSTAPEVFVCHVFHCSPNAASLTKALAEACEVRMVTVWFKIFLPFWSYEILRQMCLNKLALAKDI